ncbi:protein SCO1 homolog, mitochondrial-like [Mizuhopecten yessoensis]|uniref:Protein SCO1-like n=1 Tax=Mizuhopecten yessoensis TaxID=6573 RepID=A0A210PL27_MIZYE|nr:protein SCO1 homolog, mitochondrial-like [Mizuhopecten yessoensis]OWF37136.1 Protein SCO1-like [Mizuhopecten yessoensis]
MTIMERLLTRKICAVWMPRVFSCSRNVSRFHDCVRIKLPQQTSYPQNAGLLHRKLQKISPTMLRGLQEKLRKEKTMSWKGFAVLTIFCSCLYAAYEYVDKERLKEKMRAKFGNVGSPVIGGSWTLTDHNGHVRTDKDFLGKWLLIYFGFTHCPDICPDELEKLAKVVEHFNSKTDGPKIKPIFVTIDPERDTQEVMKKYCLEFSSEFLALTGTKEQLDDIYKKFHVFFYYGDKDETGDYLVDHTLLTFLMTPKGVYVDHFSNRVSLDSMIENISLRMEKDNPKKS